MTLSTTERQDCNNKQTAKKLCAMLSPWAKPMLDIKFVNRWAVVGAIVCPLHRDPQSLAQSHTLATNQSSNLRLSPQDFVSEELNFYPKLTITKSA
jgi:hypothetical protein